MSNYFYDQQVRKFLLQFARIFSNFEVEYGLDENNLQTYVRIPVRYGDASKQAQTILQENSANNMPSSPMMSFYITALKYDRKRIQAPDFVDKTFIRQRGWDQGSQTFEEGQGNAFGVERPMPVPYELNLSLDIWTSNTHMKLQALEQILTLFNPSLEVQSNDNFLDWTSLTVLELDDVNWSSRSVPANDTDIDIATLKFRLPIWLSPPARVTKEGYIHKVIAAMYDSEGQYCDAINNDDLLLGTRLKITPHKYQALLIGNELQIMPANTVAGTDSILEVPDEANSLLSWKTIIEEYGTLNEGITQIRLEALDTPDIVGTVTYHPLKPSILNFNIDVDTLPTNSLTAIDAVINPLSAGPGAGIDPATAGQRYLLTEDIGFDGDGDMLSDFSTVAWGNLAAKKNDIIEYNGTIWTSVFQVVPGTIDYVTNITTNIQYKTDGEAGWIRSYEGIYPGGDWSVII